MNKYRENIPCVVTIAGTDPSGGAGIQADLKSISATGCYAASVITVLVAQNTQGVHSIYSIEPEFVNKQIHSVFSDLKIAAVKIGMLYQQEIMEIVEAAINFYKPKNIVLDPVMLAKDGSSLLPRSNLNFLMQRLFPNVDLITPNLPEAEYILSDKITSLDNMEKSAEKIARNYQTNVLLKGGHFDNEECSDVLYLFDDKSMHWFHSKRVITKNTHGTGCTFSSAIASYLAQNYSLIDSVQRAKQYVSNAILSGSKNKIGLGNGPVDHFYFLESN